MTSEREVRTYAWHRGLTVRRYGEQVVVRERYGERKIVGSFRSWLSVKRAIKRHARAMEAKR